MKLLSNVSNQALFILIKSLTKAEKRHLKITFNHNMQGKDAEIYLKMFDIMDKQLKYDENKLYFLLKKHINLDKKKLANIKYLLYKKILSSLRHLYRTHSHNFEIRALLEQTEILYHKSLYNQSFIMLQKAKAIILEQEKYDYILEIIHWLNKLSPHIIFINTMSESFIEKALEKTKKNIELAEILAKIKLIYRKKGRINYVEDTKKLLAFIQNPVMTQNPQKFIFKAKISYYEILALNSRLLNNYEDSYYYYQQIIDNWEENDEKKHILSEIYLEQVFEYIWDSFMLNIHINYKKYLDNLEDLSLKSEAEKVQRRLLKLTIQYLYLLHQQQVHKDLVEEKLIYISNQEKQILGVFWEFRIQHYIGVGYFLINNIPYALKQVNILMNNQFKNINDSHKSFFYIWSLVLHYELGNFDIFDSIYRSAYRFFKKQNYDTYFEKFLMTQIRKIYNCVNNKDILNLFSKIDEYLSNSSEQDIPWQKFEYILFKTWIKAKLHQRTFLDTYRRLITKKHPSETSLDS